jgi:Flp pilus assembly protein TadD
MRADRRRCLKCDEALVGAIDSSDPAAQRDRRAVAAAVVAVFVSLAVTILLIARPAQVDHAAVRVATAATTAPPGAARASTEPAQAAAFVPVTATDHARVGAASFESGDFEAARVRFEQAVAKGPNDAESLNSLGLALERLTRTDEAIQRFARAVQLAPDKWAYHFNLAHALSEGGRLDEAIAEYRIAAGLFPADYATQYNLALALHRKGDEAAAVGEFEKAITLAPGEATFHLSLAMSLERTGRPADARREYARYLEMSPDAPDASKIRAHVEQLAVSPAAAKPPAP